MRIKRHKLFIKDFRKSQLTDGQFEKLVYFVNYLRENLQLPKESKDHALNGEYLDCREFHLGGDTLIIYLSTSTEVTLLRLGSHAQLFR
ncbi:MAG: type II toxin-antitoxin system YafQ family toxin [Methyloprofundus sp.]|nr:type II toxin-antitoxin system YafQ family toxin [Methyloprofundus sp.]